MKFRLNTRLEDKNGDLVWHGGKTIHADSLEEAVDLMPHNAARLFEIPDETAAVIITIMVQH